MTPQGRRETAVAAGRAAAAPGTAAVPMARGQAEGPRRCARRKTDAQRKVGALGRIKDRRSPDRKGVARSLLDLDDALAVVPGELTILASSGTQVGSGREGRPGPDPSIVIDRARVVGEEPEAVLSELIRPSSTSRIRSHRAQAARFRRG